MAGITLEQAQARLDAALEAAAGVRADKSVEYRGSRVQLQDLDQINRDIAFWELRVKTLTAQARGYRMVRYADDFVVLCRSLEEAEAALETVRAWVAENGLTLHPDKTHVGDCRERGDGFDFLGYRFESGRRWVRKKSLKRIKDGIRAKTRRTRGDTLTGIIADLNPMLRGWFNYFKHAHSSTFRKVDGFIGRRLRAVLRKPDKRPGIGRCLDDQKRWPNAFFAEAGLFALYPAWQAERHPR